MPWTQQAGDVDMTGDVDMAGDGEPRVGDGVTAGDDDMVDLLQEAVVS